MTGVERGNTVNDTYFFLLLLVLGREKGGKGGRDEKKCFLRENQKQKIKQKKKKKEKKKKPTCIPFKTNSNPINHKTIKTPLSYLRITHRKWFSIISMSSRTRRIGTFSSAGDD